MLFRSDLRIWAVITWRNELFYYPHGYARTSSYEYTLSNTQNFVHLTNNCLQQYGDNYGRFEDGNTIPLSVLEKYIKEINPDLDFEKVIMPPIKDYIIDTFLSAKYELNPNRRKNCFELLGFDFMIDEDFRVWLIEVNTNPYLGIPNKFIRGLLPKMLNDLFEIVLDPYLPPANRLPRKHVRNQFEILYDERRKLNARRSIGQSLTNMKSSSRQLDFNIMVIYIINRNMKFSKLHRNSQCRRISLIA